MTERIAQQMQKSASSRSECVIDGSRFNGWATPTLRAHKRRASAQDVDRSIRVRVAGETTMATSEARLALSACFVDNSAGRAFLRRIGGIDPFKRTAALFQFVGEDGFKGSPALLLNAAVQPALASARARHVRGWQCLQGNQAEPPCNADGRPVPPVSPDTSDLGRERQDHEDGLGAKPESPTAESGDAHA